MNINDLNPKNIDFDNLKSEAQEFAKEKAEVAKDTLTDSVEKLVPLALAAYGGIKTFYNNKRDEYSSSESSSAATNTLLFIAGAAIGATVGVLLAPAKGSDTRTKISNETKRAINTAEVRGKEFANQAQTTINKNVEVAKAKFEQGKQKATTLAREAREKINNNSETTTMG